MTDQPIELFGGEDGKTSLGVWLIPKWVQGLEIDREDKTILQIVCYGGSVLRVKRPPTLHYEYPGGVFTFQEDIDSKWIEEVISPQLWPTIDVVRPRMHSLS